VAIDLASSVSGSPINGESASAGPIEGLPMSRSSTTTRKRLNPEWIPNPHPGEILLEDLMRPIGLSQNALARALKVSPRRINELVHGKRAVSADTDLRLARYFGLHEGFFLGLQVAYDLMEEKRRLGKRLDEITPRAA
jgi:addiction module HigA family antidote